MRHGWPLLVLCSGVALAQDASTRVAPERFLAHVQRLSADDLRGRGNGSDGLSRAAAYVRAQFEAAGLEGAFDGHFEQPFDAEIRLDPPADTTLTLVAGTRPHQLVLGRDFYPLSIVDRLPSAPPPAIEDAPVVFAGYGISAPAVGYDDYAGIDVRDAGVLVFTHEPQEHDARSVFDGRQLTPGAAVSQKAREARERGARLLLLVEDPTHADDRATRANWWTDPQIENMGLPVVRVSREQVQRAAPGLSLEVAAAAIDRTLRPQSQRVAHLAVRYVERRAQFSARLENIVGVVRGRDATLAHESVVIGAHYDHVGLGGSLSASPQTAGQVHNGADDNASGTAALIEAAHVAVRRRARYRRTMVFAAFAGEELGLRGSEAFVNTPPLARARVRAMVNLDMVGRARGRVLVGAFGPPLPGPALLARLRPWSRLALQDFSRGGYEAEDSDSGPFARRGIPVVAFFTGFHADYHRPTDDWPSVDADGGAAIAELALRLAEDLAR